MFDPWDIGSLIFRVLHFFWEAFRDAYAFLLVVAAVVFFGYSLFRFIVVHDDTSKFLLGISSAILLYAFYNRWYYGGVSGADFESQTRVEHEPSYPSTLWRKKRRKQPDEPV